MTDAPKSSSLLSRVQSRLKIASYAKAVYYSSLAVLALAVLVVLSIRLLGLIPQSQERAIWLLSIPAVACLGAGLFYRRVEMQQAARAVDEHAQTKDLFLTLSSLSTSAGEYQPLVSNSAEQRAESVVPTEVVPFRFGERLARLVAVGAIFALAVMLTPQLDPLGKVEAATKAEKQITEIDAIRKEAMARRDRLKKEEERAEDESEEMDFALNKLKSDFRKMMPKKLESNARVLDSHRLDLGDMWKSVSNDQLRKMMNQPISDQQLGNSTRSKKMNEMLKELQEGKTDMLKKELQNARETMQAMAKAKTKEERQKLQSKLQKELQDLQKFSRSKAGSKELANALSKAMKALEVARNSQKKDGEPGAEESELTKDAMEALKESLELSEKEMESVAQAAKDLKKLDEALKTLTKAQELNQKGELDGSKCEGCESMEDYAELYAQLNNESGQGPGNRGQQKGFGKGGEAQYDDSDPEGYKTEKEKAQVRAGKILLSIKTKEYASEIDFDPDKMREYQQSVGQLKSSVQSAIDTEEIPPGYVDGIKGYFDKIENVDPKLKSN